MCEQVLAKADALEALDASISTLKYLREKEEDINLQIEAAVAFSGQHGVVAESELATRHRHRQPRTQVLSSGKERPWSELVTCHPDSGW